MHFTASEVAEATSGTLVGPDVVCDGASIDSRTIAEGALFVPIVGERDGHEFIAAALAAGAGAYLTQHEPEGGTAIVVHDNAAALTDLGRMARRRHTGPVIGVTGSVGKTSVKDLTSAAIGGALRVYANERSFNNELGVPLTLCNAPDDTEVLVVEMGARGVGHIAALCEMAKPTIAIVTWVGAVHTSEFGSVEAVARGKRELIESLPSDGTAILNADCALVVAMASATDAAIVLYGVGGDIEALDVSLDSELRPTFTIAIDDERFRVSLPVHGLHQASNSLAAVAAARAVGVDPADAIAGLATARLSPWRMELSRSSSGAAVINDAYNANAISTAAALRSLAALSATRHIAVLGVMAELGAHHDADHRAMAVLCSELGIELIAYRESAYGVAPVEDFDAVLMRIGDLGPTDAVLVKASRVAQLEALAALLMSPGEAPT